MKVSEVLIKGNTIITITDKSKKIPYGSIGLTKKDCVNQFYAFVKRLKNKGLYIWHTKPLTKFNESLVINHGTEININGGFELHAVIVINPILTNLDGEPIKDKVIK